jgi:hypothetical protein
LDRALMRGGGEDGGDGNGEGGGKDACRTLALRLLALADGADAGAAQVADKAAG